MISQKVLKDIAGWACIAVAAVVVGLLLAANGSGAGKVIAGVGAALLALCALSLAYEFFRRDGPDDSVG